MGGPGAGGAVGVAQKASWKLLFFAAACCVTASAVIGILMFIAHFEVGFTLTSEIFLVFFGLLMIVLDFPVNDKHPAMHSIRTHTYSFLLFMTRFTGRGLWYMFLGTMCFAVLWDDNGDKGPLPMILGFVLGGFVFALGCAATFKGLKLTKQFDECRKQCLQKGDQGAERAYGSLFQGYDPRSQYPPSPVSEHIFQRFLEEYCGHKFSDDEMIYLVNALSFTPNNDRMVGFTEVQWWLQGDTTQGLPPQTGILYMQMV